MDALGPVPAADEVSFCTSILWNTSKHVRPGSPTMAQCLCFPQSQPHSYLTLVDALLIWPFDGGKHRQLKLCNRKLISSRFRSRFDLDARYLSADGVVAADGNCGGGVGGAVCTDGQWAAPLQDQRNCSPL